MTTTSTEHSTTEKLSAAMDRPPVIMMECGAAISKSQMERFVESFQKSAWRWEAVVYPALFAFVVLAGYGFFLVYSLTGDMATIARHMDANMGEHMDSMTKNINELTEQISVMSAQIQMMTATMGDISVKLDTLPPMLQHIAVMEDSMTNMNRSMIQITKSVDGMGRSIANMDNSIHVMDGSMKRIDESVVVITGITGNMQKDFTRMNRNMSNISRPASFANNFIPW
jgi:uncharacterized protein YoxC